MQTIAKNAAALLSVIGIGVQAIVCFMIAEGPIGSFHIGLFGAASLSYLISLSLALRTSLWLAALVIAVACLLLDFYALYGAFVAPTSSTEALSLLVVPVFKLLGVVPIGLLCGILANRFMPKSR